MVQPINKIAFVGAGNMAQAIIDGLIKSGIQSQNIVASAKSQATMDAVTSRFEIKTGSNHSVCENADVVVLAVKPQTLKSVCEDIKPSLEANTLVISLAAGISMTSLETWLGAFAMVRCMPNTPAAIGLGASALFANDAASGEQKKLAERILSAVGLAVYVNEEALIDAVTAVSGSGPAYFFLFIEAMTEAGVKLGLEPTTAAQLAKQTALGSASLAQASTVSVEQLRANVTSPNGTTERAIKSFESNKLRYIVEQAMQACVHRAQELATELGAEQP